MKLSVIIPCLNEEHYVGRLLASLAHQTMPDFEVVVADSISADRTVEVAESFKGKLNLRIVKAPQLGAALARNTGAKAASGEWLIFLDADVELPDENFLKVTVEQAEKRGLITASPIYKVRSGSAADRLGSIMTLRYQKLLSRTKHPVACGFCIVTRRDVFENCGGFDRSLKIGEDYDYVSRSAGQKNAFRFIDETYFLVDLRRFEEGGKFKVFLQSIYYEIYRFTHGFRIDKDPFNYQFGQHKPKKGRQDK